MNSEEGIRAHAEAAQQHGATLHCSEKVQRWRVLPSGDVAVTTEKATYTAGKLVLTAGAWMPEMVPELQAGFLLQTARINSNAKAGINSNRPP